MSAFVVSDDTINKILSVIDQKIGHHGHMCRNYLQNNGRGPVGDGDLTSMGRAMLELNYDSVDSRYKKGTFGDKETEVAKYTFKRVKVTPVQAFKSLQCYLYQSCEGDCYEDHYYKFLDGMAKDMAQYIVQYSAEYDSAEWG